jgi:hypothetical protein
MGLTFSDEIDNALNAADNADTVRDDVVSALKTCESSLTTAYANFIRQRNPKLRNTLGE